MARPLSILDLARVAPHETVAESFAASVEIARHAEALGFHRVWYAEHHNMRSIASSATSVLIGHVATQTSTIRLGAGGIMLPNHSPLQIAEQFGTLETLHPGRIDLGLGRAPGTDQVTLRALRHSPADAEHFPQDVIELQAYLSEQSRVPGVTATPGHGTHVPLYILGSSLFGAQLAAVLGLPYGFASHFAPPALRDAVALYRREFQPSEQLPEPYVIAGVNVIAADDEDTAREQYRSALIERAKLFLHRGGGPRLTDDEALSALESPAGQQIKAMTKYFAVGTPDQVSAYLDDFAQLAEADELIVVPNAPDRKLQLRSLEIVAEVSGLAPRD
ncbi:MULTISPECIES: LLM class flavin-dependent oxidoreductase [Mycobacteroides]|uniref:Alkane 1-monooxygenase n=1 Tax=Mycobacteroides chelonae TaxID=1774 RepID=A0A1S1LLW5_MYCCH|nr:MULTISPECIES: LLM class flavin-dependent oxidoreductase [Mycobacteroides]KRQ18297.1 alkane 1-monooxygenase [Mycobacteroides sp. H003]KRQ25573.1 alkane 1-monooxygenase [Mycobacteroides sp. H092]KRQ33637.1 alkane 1-monooxygenase [Mycobacteroides sp. H101]KRQ45204.1 alkane 1-monooxygenase [Mycobacteroides sp. H063]KRQ56255.1 alkane 1-monooxygenase [Mycobacteroides sp. HXVII]